VKPFPLVLSSPSGAGKTTIAQALLAARDDLGYSISATTRAPRPGEEEGRDYFFLTREEFQRRVSAGDFVEWAEYSGQLYGTLVRQVEEVLATGRHVVLDIEIQGARAVKRRFPESVLVFILPPSANELLSRLGGSRGTRSATLVRRLRRAVEEIAEAPQYDYVLINEDRTASVAEVAAILDAESRRPCRMPELAEQLAALGRDLSALASKLETSKEG
jgi:guanylate kinase